MSPNVIYIAVTGHGFGHAVRACAITSAITKLCPNILPVMVTTAPRWLLESYLETDFIHRPRSFDVGVIQSDSLKMDKQATLEKMRQIRAQQKSIIAAEVAFIQLNKVKLILADIPPLAAPIAEAAGIPCWMMSNFGWDFIYQDWGDDFQEIVDWITDCYQKCDRLFRLPMHEPMKAFNEIIDVGLTGGTPRYTEEELRGEFNLTAPAEKTILLTFGGLGLEKIPYHNLEKFPHWQFITFDGNAPPIPNLIKITTHNYRPVDFMPLCGRVVSKPGYSTFAEALRLEIPLVSLTREDFAEANFLLEGMRNYSPHQIITPTEFFGGDWQFLRQPLQPPRLDTRLPKDGAEAIARAVRDFLY